MAAPLAELTARAQTLTSAGDLVGARRVLANVLDPADADPRHADADLALAAALHARILIALGDPHGARLWAGFAHAAEERLHGPQHERTLAAAATHAAVLQRVGHYGRAAQVYQRLLGSLAALDGADSARALAAEADLATAEHAAGHCTSARARLTDAWVRHRHHHGDAAPAGIKMLARLGAMERECARDAESREHLALAQELCARYLPADHPLVRQVAALAVSPATGRHVCGRVEQSIGPQDTATFPAAPARFRASPGTPAGAGAAAPPSEAGAGAAAPPNEAGAGAGAPPSEAGAGTAAPPSEPPTATRPAPPGRPQTASQPTPPGAPQAAPPGPPQAPFPAAPLPAASVPHPRRPSVQAEDEAFPPDVHDPDRLPATKTQAVGRPAGLVQPLYRPQGGHAYHVGRNPPFTADGNAAYRTGSGPAQRDDSAAYHAGHDPASPDNSATYRPGRDTAYRDDNNPAYGTGGAPGDLTGRHARIDAPPPPPGGRAADHHRDDDSLLPVRLEAPEPVQHRQPFLLAAVLIAGIAVVAAVVVLALTRDNDTTAGPGPASVTSAAPPATEATTAPTPVTPADPGAPTAVALRDNRDSVALSWTYPRGVEGPLLVSGGRQGQPLKVFQQLAAGTGDYLVYGLNESVNYCFTVAVAYSTDRIAASAPVCTRR